MANGSSFSVLVGVVLLLAVLCIGAGGGNSAPPLRGIDAQLAVPGEAEAGWVRQSETRLGGIEARLWDIETRNRVLEQARLDEAATKVAEKKPACEPDPDKALSACVDAGGSESTAGHRESAVPVQSKTVEMDLGL